MRDLSGDPFDGLRNHNSPIGPGDETCGQFFVPADDGTRLLVQASQGGLWDHVSVSHPLRCPTWGEMSRVKRLFFEEHEWAVEYHPPAARNISVHPYCLHLWRPQGVVFPKPPEWMIA